MFSGQFESTAFLYEIFEFSIEDRRWKYFTFVEGYEKEWESCFSNIKSASNKKSIIHIEIHE